MIAESLVNSSTVYPSAVSFEFNVDTKGLPAGAKPTIIPGLQPALVALNCFNKTVPLLARAVDC